MRADRPAAISLALLTTLVVTQPAAAQAFPGSWSVRNAQGGVTTLVLTDAGSGKLGGTFSGNGNTFSVSGVVKDDEATGLISGRGMALYFQAQVKGTTLLLVLAEPGPGGSPNMATAQQVVMVRRAAGTIAGGATAGPTEGGAGSTAGAPAEARVAPGSGEQRATAATGASRAGLGVASAQTTQDRQLAQVLTANAWCAFSYSGSQTYAGSSGTTRTERVVLAPDGRVLSNNKSEFAGSVETGSAVVSRDGGADGFWKLANGVLAFSADGQTFEAANFRMTYNSNGYPIPVVNGKEFMICR